MTSSTVTLEDFRAQIDTSLYGVVHVTKVAKLEGELVGRQDAPLRIVLGAQA